MKTDKHHAPTVIPWRQWMELGLGVMNFSPEVFWRMSLAEWLAARDGVTGASAEGLRSNPVMRRELDRLMRNYPDKRNGE